jgi:hypothetical protein
MYETMCERVRHRKEGWEGFLVEIWTSASSQVYGRVKTDDGQKVCLLDELGYSFTVPYIAGCYGK